MHVEISDGAFMVDASLLGKLLGVPPQVIPSLMREHAITSVCERGVDTHQGEFRLSFFYGNRRVRLKVDTSGQVLQRSSIDFGERALPNTLRRPGD